MPRQYISLKDPSPQNLQVLQRLQNKVNRTQNEYKQAGWNTVRTIHNTEVLLVEYALECMISPELAPDYAYRVGREYAERDEPSYGTGLIPASVPMLEDIVQFWRAYYDL